MRIGLDIDGVMYEWDKTARYMLREVLPNSPYKDSLRTESQSWNYIQEMVLPEHWDWLWDEGVKLGLFRYGHLFPGTIQAVRALAQKNEIIIITHRPKQAVNDTLDWLSYLKLPLTGVHILSNGEKKSSVLPHCDIYLDDKPENIVDYLLNTEAASVLREQPWNRVYARSASWGMVSRHNYKAHAVNGWDGFAEAVANA